MVHFPVNGEGGHVSLEIEFVSRVRSVEHEIGGEGPLLGPVGIRSADEVVGAEGEGGGALGGGVRDGVNFSAHGGGPEDAVVAKSAAVWKTSA